MKTAVEFKHFEGDGFSSFSRERVGNQQVNARIHNKTVSKFGFFAFLCRSPRWSLQRTFHVQMIPLCARVLRTLLVDILWSLNSLLFPKGSVPQASVVFNGGEESFVRPGRMNQGRKRVMCAHWPLAPLLLLALCPHWHFCPGRLLFKLWTMRQGKPQACLWAGC